MYGALDIFLLFCDHQDTEYEACEIYISISQPIFTHKNISEYIWINDIHTLRDGEKILW